MGNTAFFQRHLDVLKEQSESWKVAHEEVMRNHDACDMLSEYVAMMLFLLNRIDTLTNDLNVTRAKVVIDVLPVWFVAADALLELVDKCEQAGFRVENSDVLRRERHDVADSEEGIARLRRGVEDFEAGRCRPIDEVFNEILQRSARP